MNIRNFIKESSPENAERPSLYASALRERSAPVSEGFSILASLEPPPRRGARAGWVFGVVVVIAAGVFAFFHDEGDDVRGGEPVMGKMRQSSTSSGPSVPAETVTAATIESESAGADAALVALLDAGEQDVDVPATTRAATEPGQPEEKSGLAAPVSGQAGVMAAAKTHNEVLAGLLPGAKETLLRQYPEKPRNTRHAKRAKGTRRPSKAVAGTKEKDKDVALIAALLSHVSASDSRTMRKSQGAPAAKKTDPDRAALLATPGVASSEMNRDVIVRAAGDSTAVLVERCQALGLLEGQLCRLRICSGFWGKDPACPAGGNASADH